MRHRSLQRLLWSPLSFLVVLALTALALLEAYQASIGLRPRGSLRAPLALTLLPHLEKLTSS